MAKAIAKKEFSFSDLKKKFSSEAKFKEQKYFYVGKEFLECTGLPGTAYSAINMFLGHSNTSKTTAAILTAVDAQRNGVLPVFVITEQKWDFDHAKTLGLQCEKQDDNSWDGFFLFNNDFKYIEQMTDYINTLLDAQEKGELPYDLLFIIDSIGSIPCKMTFEGKGGKQHNAAALAEKIGMGIHQRITSTRREDVKHSSTMVVINQPWVELPDNPYGVPTIKPKGGEAIYLASSLVFLFGNQKNSGVSHIDLTHKGRKVAFATRSKISVLKNHISGIAYKDGKILATAHGYIKDDPEAIKKYKAESADYWNNILGVNSMQEVDFDESEEMFDDVSYEE